MMKKTIKNPILVEGSHDKSKVLSIYNAIVFVLNGFEINDELISFLNKLNTDTIILSDNDEAGDVIRNKLETKLVRFKSIKVDNSNLTTIKKGVAETSNEAIITALDNLSSPCPLLKTTNVDLIKKNLVIKDLKLKYNLNSLSNKEFLLCLTLLKINNIEEI